jgi:hypothetical protein
MEQEIVYLSVDAVARRRSCSWDKASRELEKHRGQSGFMDLGSPEDVRRKKRKFAIIRIHPALLAKIENDRK